MEPVSFTLDFVARTITVLFPDESTKVYANTVSYVVDYPDRAGDAAAVWELNPLA